jgi:hypothetical protein
MTTAPTATTAPTTNSALFRTLPPHLLAIRQRRQHARTQLLATISTDIRWFLPGRSGPIKPADFHTSPEYIDKFNLVHGVALAAGLVLSFPLKQKTRQDLK